MLPPIVQPLAITLGDIDLSLISALIGLAVTIPVQYCIVNCVFFFQAEDGIRDYKVTGVQTCALPICRTTETRRCAARSRTCAAPRWRKSIRGSTASRSRRASRRRAERAPGARAAADRKSVV